MGIDVIHFRRLHAGIDQRHLHRPDPTLAVLRRGRDVVGIAAQTVPDNLGVDMSPPRQCMLEFLQDEHP